MPYITEKRRHQIDMGYPYSKCMDEGDLAYRLTGEYLLWMRAHEMRFKCFARLVGVIVLSLFEFWWRVVRPYEDKKKEENGDVYPKN